MTFDTVSPSAAAAAAPRPRQRVIPIESPRFIPAATLGAPHDWSQEFGRRAPLALEIGCGTGHFVLQCAVARPDRDFLAIDIYNKGCLKTCRKLDAAGLANVRVLRIEARELLAGALAAESLEAIYINCPDPWPKKRHRDRRLVNGEFLTLALGALRPEGELFFASDCLDYAEEVAAAFAGLSGYRNRLATPIATALPGYPLSKYMRRFLERGEPIHYLHHQRDPAVPLPERSPLDLERGFRARPQRPARG